MIHLVSYRHGGAGRAAWRIHQAMLNFGVNSNFIDLSSIAQSLSGFEKHHYTIKDKFRWRLKTHFGIYIDARERLIQSIPDPFPDIRCEIATVPTHETRISALPVFKDADIIHLHWVAQFFDYADFFNNVSQKIVWTLHDLNPIQGMFHYRQDQIQLKKSISRLDQRIQKYKKQQIRKAAGNLAVVTLSNWLKEEAIKSRIVGTSNISLIPNPLDLNVFRPNPKKAKEELSLPQNKILLLAVAEYIWIYRKGFDLLKEAVKSLSNVHLLLIGIAPDSAVEENNVSFTGKIDDDDFLSQLYSTADATVIPSREDNLPNVMLESLACGTPVISFKVGGMLDHICDFKTGILADEISSDSLADAIQLFIDNKDQFNREQIRAYAKAHFNEKLIADQYVAVYNNLLSKERN